MYMYSVIYSVIKWPFHIKSGKLLNPLDAKCNLMKLTLTDCVMFWILFFVHGNLLLHVHVHVVNLTNNKIVYIFTDYHLHACIPILQLRTALSMLCTPFFSRYNMCELYFSVNQIMLWFLFEINVHCSLKQCNSYSSVWFLFNFLPVWVSWMRGPVFKLSNVQGPSLNCGNCSKLN